jgi:large subunit ribosomal protein L25
LEPVSLKVKPVELEKAYKEAGESALVSLVVNGGETYNVIVKDVQKGITKNQITHVDFYKVDMKKAIEVEIPLEFTGEAKAEKELGGTLIKSTETVKIKCLPTDLVESIAVDISGLNTFDDSIRFGDLKLPGDMELLENPEDMVVHVMETKVEAEAPVAAETPVEAKPEAENAKENKEEKS